jgi:hypothetical protein
MTTTLNTQTLTNQALPLFWEAVLRGKFLSIWADLSGRYNRLLDLEEKTKQASHLSRHHVGIKTVDIRRIRGTQGKADEFDAEFNPMHERSRDRWLGIAIERMRGRDLPPVELIQIGNIYFVRDGHHRVSVARSMGQTIIDAEVIVLKLL